MGTVGTGVAKILLEKILLSGKAWLCSCVKGIADSNPEVKNKLNLSLIFSLQTMRKPFKQPDIRSLSNLSEE